MKKAFLPSIYFLGRPEKGHFPPNSRIKPNHPHLIEAAFAGQSGAWRAMTRIGGDEECPDISSRRWPPSRRAAAPPASRLKIEPSGRCTLNSERFSFNRPHIGDRGFPYPRHHANIPFWAWRRFSASSQTTERGPSITSSATSSPRWAGRQCMNRASGAARAISAASMR